MPKHYFFILILVIFLAIIPVYFFRIKNRKPSSGTTIPLKGISFDWLFTIIFVFIVCLNFPTWQSSYWMLLLHFAGMVVIISQIYDVLYQILYQHDFLVITDTHIHLYNSRYSSVKLNEIKTVSLNGISNIVTVKGNGFVSFKKDRIDPHTLRMLFNTIREHNLNNSALFSENLTLDF